MPMATATSVSSSTTTTTATTKLVCFSFAAYAKTLIHNLKSLNIPILPGLSDQEFAAIESDFRFTFPPDLRSLLREGLPVGVYFPNWRSSSPQQLQLLLNLPFLNLSKNIARNNFWVNSWGQKTENDRKIFEKAPILVPIYGNCYIPSSPCAAGNPVFYVDDCTVRVLGFDLARFFEQVEFFKPRIGRSNNRVSINVPAWAATAARRVEFWTEVAESGRRAEASVDSRGWWTSGEEVKKIGFLSDCLEGVFWKLRNGGWREEDVREMMMMDGCDEKRESRGVHSGKMDVLEHVRVLSVVLLRAGWSREDVVYLLDLQDNCGLDFPISNSSSCASALQEDDHRQKQLMRMQSLEV